MRFFIVIFIIFPSSLYAQKKLDNTIIVNTTKNIKEIKQTLFNCGFTIDGADTSFFTTTIKEVNGASVMKLMIARNDTSVTIKGQAKILVEIMGVKNDFMTIEYRLAKSNLNYEWFREMDKFDKLLGDKITYLKQ
jgi:hypothetical protein